MKRPKIKEKKRKTPPVTPGPNSKKVMNSQFKLKNRVPLLFSVLSQTFRKVTLVTT